VATAAGGAWVVVRYILDRNHDKPAPEKRPDHREPAPGRTVSAGSGVAAGGNMQIGGNVSIQHNRIPKAAIALAALGLLVLGYAAFNSGSHVDVRNGNYVGGNVTNSQINNR
jgi:ammonia channel protein AmtB